jgi:hypothetical protein
MADGMPTCDPFDGRDHECIRAERPWPMPEMKTIAIDDDPAVILFVGGLVQRIDVPA